MTRRDASAAADDAGGSAPPPAPRGAPRFKLALLGIAGLLLVSAPVWAPLFLRRMAFFHVRRVEIIGAHYVAPGDILSRLHVDTMASVWDPTSPLAARVTANPEIQTAVIQRKLPGTLVVQVTERVPVALVPASNGFLVYDERGRQLPIEPARVDIDAPVLMERDAALLRLLGTMRARTPALYARVSSMRRGGRNEVVFQLESWSVRAMQDVTPARLGDLEAVEDDLVRKQLRVSEIDLRYRDQVIARLQ